MLSPCRNAKRESYSADLAAEACVKRTRASSFSRAAPESMDSAARLTPSRKFPTRPAATSAADAFARTMSR